MKTTPESIWQYDDTPAYYIHKLAIRRKYAGRGLGRSILSSITALAASHTVAVIRLNCVTANQHLQSYYIDCGFRLIGSSLDEGTEVSLFEKSVV